MRLLLSVSCLQSDFVNYRIYPKRNKPDKRIILYKFCFFLYHEKSHGRNSHLTLVTQSTTMIKKNLMSTSMQTDSSTKRRKI